MVFRNRNKSIKYYLNIDNNLLLTFGRATNVKNGYCFISNNITYFRAWTCPGMTTGDYSTPLYVNKKESNLLI